MKVLISDYSSIYSTEPYYFNTTLNIIDCQSSIWPQNISTFDAFDTMKPDVHITHHSKISRDLILYFQENNSNIDLLINISHITQDNLDILESVLKEAKIKPAALFVNYYDHNLKSKYTSITTILHGTDLFLGTEPKQYDIDYGIFIDNKTQIHPIGETYHYLTNLPNLEKDVDIFLPINRLSHCYHNYRNVVLKYFKNEFSQLFFDASMKTPVFFDIENREILDQQLNKLFGEGAYCTLTDPNSGNIAEKIKNKHTCLHRTKSLLSQLSCKEYIDKLQDLIERSIK